MGVKCSLGVGVEGDRFYDYTRPLLDIEWVCG